MKITELLFERLGNLAQLNAGNLINILKQNAYSGYRDKTPRIYGDEKKFVNRYKVGAGSEIVDAGKIKSIADVRKIFRTHNKNNTGNPVALCIYIGDTAVIFATFDGEDLAGPTRTGKTAWDFSKFKYEPDPKDWRALPAQSQRDKEENNPKHHWNYDGPDKKIKVRYTGEIKTTSGLAEIIDKAKELADANNLPLTMKVVMSDTAGHKKRMDRSTIKRDLEQTGDDLMTRLKKYKNSKKPTAENIMAFLRAVMSKEAASLQFAGDTYRTNADINSYGEKNKLKLTVEQLFAGVPFDAEYETVEPGSSDSIDVKYCYSNGTLVPISATYYDKAKPGFDRYNGGQVTEIINPTLYATKLLRIKDPNNKDSVIPKMLLALKEQKFKDVKIMLNLMKQMGHDWPELAMIEKSMNAELNKSKDNPGLDHINES